ncbi:MAG: hypothetical protein KDD60_01735 [Bdellovibrionales bacterium]|nr:hypothetical protein [Bdellovibrionales bacterium]
MTSNGMTLDAIASRWSALENRGLPDGHFKFSVNGRSVTLVQSEIAGMILTYLQTNGSLGSRQRSALQSLIKELESGLSTMNDDCKSYFGDLLSIAGDVLGIAHDQPV